MNSQVSHVTTQNSKAGPNPLASARGYGRAKSRQDIEGALAFCTEDFVMEAIPFATRAAGKGEVTHDLRRFFELFPDYEFVSASETVGRDAVVLSGYLRMTWTGRLPRSFGWWTRFAKRSPRRVELPATAVFETRDGHLAHERFFFDVNALAEQLGLPLAAVFWMTRRLERERHAAVHGKPAIREEHTVVVHAPIDRVFDFAFADVQQLRRATPRIPFFTARKFELAGADVMTKGALRRVHLSSGHVMNERIELCERPRQLHYRIENGFGFPIDAFIADARGEHELEALEPGVTRVTWRAFAYPRSRWTAPITSLLAATILRPMQRRFLRSIADALAAS